MDCEYAKDCLSAYLDGELSEEEREAVRHHLAICPECAQLLEDLAAVSVWTRDALSSVTAPSWLELQVMKRISSLGQTRHVVQLTWLAVFSALAVTALTVGSGFTAALSVMWAVAKVLVRFVGGLHITLVRLWLGQGWGIMVAIGLGMAITLLSLVCIKRLMKHTWDPSPTPHP